MGFFQKSSNLLFYSMQIGLDISGGDKAPLAILEGALQASEDLPKSITLVLFGNAKEIQSFLDQNPSLTKFVRVEACGDPIEMGDHPAKAWASKPDSSIVKGFMAHKKGDIDAFISAGNSGALLVGSHRVLGVVEGVQRPCITSVMPKENGGMGILLDAGINPDSKPELLRQFAIMGARYTEMVYNLDNPKVGLINIGTEPGKGSLVCQQAYETLSQDPNINFIGNIESRDLYNDKADVMVCDGFTGNVLLKHAETHYRLLAKRGMLDEFFHRFNYENYGGTPILGVNGTVILGHGISSATAVKNMILQAIDVASSGLNDKLKMAFQA